MRRRACAQYPPLGGYRATAPVRTRVAGIPQGSRPRALPHERLAGAVTVHGRHADLLNALVVVDRELMLASHDLDALRERATREARSMGPTGDRVDALE